MRVYRWVGLDSRTLSYADFFCLWLNVDTAAAADNFHRTVTGVLAMGKGRLPREWIAAAVNGLSGVQEWKNWDGLRLLNG